MAYIGEILYASSRKEDGLAWTREAVDVAEVEARRKDNGVGEAEKRRCKQCLEVGLGNWEKMVGRLAREEKRGKEEGKGKKGGGWLGFGGGGGEEDVIGRWESEEKVVEERMKRAREILGDKIVIPVGGGKVMLSA